MRSEVQVLPDPPFSGAIAQLGEHLLCKQGVVGSIPTGSTSDTCQAESRKTASSMRVFSSGFWPDQQSRALLLFFKNSEVVKAQDQIDLLSNLICKVIGFLRVLMNPVTGMLHHDSAAIRPMQWV